jgi:hypothetical protein
MKEIKLGGKYGVGCVALVDDEDFEKVNKFKWRAIKDRKTYYVIRTKYVNGKKRKISMHRFIMNTPRKLEVDHIDNNGLNNQKYNMRNCTHAQNMMNINKGKMKGVTFKKSHNKYVYWCAQIRVNGKNKHLGLFPYTDEGKVAAAKAYDNAAKQYFGEFANFNNL